MTKTEVIRDRLDRRLLHTAGMLPLLLPTLLAVLAVRDTTARWLRGSIRSQRAFTTAEWVMILGVVTAIVIAVGAVIKNKIVDKSNDLDLSTP